MAAPDDLLPKPPANADRSRPAKTIVLWVVLVAMFIAIYNTFDESGAKDAKHTGPSGWMVFAIVLAVIIVVLVGYVMWLSRTFRKFNVANTEAITALARGEYKRGIELWQPWSRSLTDHVRLVARYNIGWTQLRSGELREALRSLIDNDRELKLKNHVRSLSATNTALCAALLRDLDTARAWLAEAETRVANEPTTPSVHASLALVRAVIACRGGLAEDAVRVLDDRWAEYENVATGEVIRPMRLVRAYAIAAAGSRNAGMADAALLLTKPTHPAEYDYLTVEWPELAAFVASHQLR